MQRLWNLNWENITYDHDISGLIRGLTDWGVIEGGTVVENKLQPVQAIIPLVRSNGQKILAFFESDEVINLPTSGDYKVYIEVDQGKIDFGGNNTEDWSGIAEIKTWPTLPSQNFLLIASVTAGQVKDERSLIPKIQSVATRTAALEQKATQAEQKIEKLEEGNWADHLEFRGFFWDREKNVTPAEEVVFVRQKLPVYEFSNLDLNLGKEATNKEIHIQRLSSGKTSKQISLKLKKIQLPITNIEVEVRKGVVVNVDAETCYWYGGELLATGVITNNKITVDYSKIIVELNKAINLPKGGLYSIVLRQAGGIVNATNYYQIGCDTTQRSTAFGAVKVNGNTRTQTKWMPFCESDAFLEEAIVHYRTKSDEPILTINSVGNPNDWAGDPVDFFCPIDNPYLSFTVSVWYAWGLNGISLIQDGKTIGVDKNKPWLRVALKRGPAKIKVDGYKATIVNVKFLFGSNTEELKVVAKNWEHYILGKSYGFGLAGFFNWKRIGPQIDTANPSTSATTGTIAPGNYVSYLTVIGPDGKKYKIWAYAE